MESVVPAPDEQPPPTRITVERYFGLVAEGALDADDRVELLEGVVVSMAPQDPPHAGNLHRIASCLRSAVGRRAMVREDKPLILGRWSVPEPDVAVVPHDPHDYLRAHPTTALLIVEVADSSLPQDRLTKAALYAAFGIAEYWIANVRNGTLEVHRQPDRTAARYREVRVVGRGERLTLAAFPDVDVLTDDLLPPDDAP